MESLVPEFIGKYAIRRQMGAGAMGVVYEGFDPHIERKVAIKCLHPKLVMADASGQFLQRFKQEAQAAAKCSHPNIVTILEYGELTDSPYIVMEYVEGVNLQDLLKQKRIRHLKNVISFVGQILNALQVAHEQGIVHRDIKPANVLVLNNGTVKLADFGIARVPTDQNLTHSGIAIGTPRYMSPEQAMAQPTDHRTDIYSLTMMFAQLLAELTLDKSVPARCIGDVNGLVKNHYINTTVPVPTVFIPIIEKGLAFVPETRIQTAREYLESMRVAVDSLKNPTPDAPISADAETELVAMSPDYSSAVFNSASSELVLQPEPEPLTQSELLPTSTSAFDPLELQSLQSLLSGYIGPIARNIVESESLRYQQSADLALALSSEISDPQERAEFLRNWESSSGQSTAQKLVLRETTSHGGGAPILTDEVRDELVQAYALHVGPMASRLVAMHESECDSLARLASVLASEIPDDEDRRQFERRVSKL